MKRLLCRVFISLVGLCFAVRTSGADLNVYNMEAIMKDPLDAAVLKSTEKDGIVTEEVEFTADKDAEGKPIRIFGIIAFPKGASKLPAIMWGQSGMYAAGTWAPHLFAKKGYVGFNITAPIEKWNAYGSFNVSEPQNANLVRYTIEHMRAITYLCSRPEVDPERIGMGGSSYGGVYATLIAGIDPRVKAGMSFFAGGAHYLGSNLPQFTGLKSKEEIEIFKQVADGATWIKKRNVPFLWGIAANDHWFHLSAVVKTFEESPGEKRMAILPFWAHGFPENVDNQLLDWFDVYLTKTRAPYNEVSTMAVTNESEKLFASWSWKGANKVKRAELIVSWGRVLPWHGWVHRYYHVIPADINQEKQTAKAEIPVPELDMEALVLGNIIDEKEVIISSVPITIVPSKFGMKKPQNKPVVNAFPYGDFEPADIDFFVRAGDPYGTVDKEIKHSGTQSIRIETPGEPFGIKLFNVPERGHKLSLWLRAERETTVSVQVKGVYPQNWNTPGVQVVLKDIPGALPIPTQEEMPSFEMKADLNTDWKKIELNCPYAGKAVEGYRLVLTGNKENPVKYWLDEVKFEVQWQ